MGANETFMNMLRSTPKPRETCGELCREIAEAHGITLRAVQMRFAKLTGNSPENGREVTAKEKAVMLEVYPKKENLKRTATVRMKAGESPEVKASPGYLSRLGKIDFDTILVRGLLALGIIGHAVLVWHEMGYLWGSAGLIAGCVVAILIFSSVVLMRKERNVKTSENMLWFVWLLDGAAFFVHKAALYHGGTTAFAAGINEFGTGCLAAVICLCAGALLYFYRETGIKK